MSWKLQFDHVVFFEFSQGCPKRSEFRFEKRFGPSMWPLRIYKNHMALKNLVRVVIENALDQWDCIVFIVCIILISQKLFVV